MRDSLSQRKKEDSNPTPLPGCPLFSKQVWLHSQFFFRGGQCGNRTRYAELFRLPLYQLSLPTKIMCRGRQRTRTSRAVHGARIAFQAISAPRGIAFRLENRGPLLRHGPGRGSTQSPSLGQAESGDATYGCHRSGRSPSPRRTGGVTGRDLGLTGLRSRVIPASSGVRHPFLSLHA